MRTKKIYGSPGTGKTFTLMNEFANAIKKTGRPDRIGLLTFTRAARDEAARRTGRPLSDLPWLRTVHSACFRALAATRNQILTAIDLKAFGKEYGIELSGNVRDPWFNSMTDAREWGRATRDDQIIQRWHLARHRGVELRHVLPTEVQTHYAKWIVDSYETWKNNEGLFDYTDLLIEMLNFAQTPKLDHLFVDEAQDLSWLQWQVVQRFARDVETLTVAGDDDQAIFDWAGARAELLNRLHADEQIVLPVSHRLPRCILKFAMLIISRVRSRVQKQFVARNADGFIDINSGELNADTLEGETLVLYRNNHQAISLADRLDEIGVLFEGAGSVLNVKNVREAIEAWRAFCHHKNISRDHANALIDMTRSDWLQPRARQLVRDSKNRDFTRSEILLREPDEDEWVRALRHVPRIEQFSRAFHRGGSSIDRLLAPRVKLLSVHQAKGMEADTVVIDPSMARRSFEQLFSEDRDTEHRVWYVAATRARNRMIILPGATGQRYPF